MILVTGGAGFIGSHIVRALVESGMDVVVLDDLSSGSSCNLPSGVRLIQADVSDARVSGVITELRPSAVIHAAAQVSVSSSVLDPARDRAVNVEGTANVISGSLKAGVERFVFLSSGGAVYGECDGASEFTLPKPASYYGAHKYLAERYLELSGLSYATARLANVYGPGQRAGLEGGVVAIFLEKLLGGDHITINGTGSQSRDFVYVSDVGDAVLTMLDSCLNGTWNVGTGLSTTILDLLLVLEDELGTTPSKSHVPPRPGDVENSRLLPDKFCKDLGWTPRHSLSSGLKQTLSKHEPL